MGFSYHNNLIQFDAGHYQLLGSSNFTVDTFAISSGQDPDHVNAVGDMHVLDTSQDEPTLDFRAGRHNTDAIAQFWKQYVNPDQTTANDQPDQLNFAFTGTLGLQLKLSSTNVLLPSGPTRTVYLKNMALGQGSYQDDNGSLGGGYGRVTNWWVGGKSCSYQATDTVRCQGVDEKGALLLVDLRHSERAETTGSHDANVIHLVGVTDIAPNGFRPRRNAPGAV